MRRTIAVRGFVLAFVLWVVVSPMIAQVDLKKTNAELGLNPKIPVPFSQRTSSSFTNIRVYESTNHQSEISASISPVNSLRLVAGANTDPGQGYYYSTNGGTSWTGSDQLLQTTALATDPAVAFDRNGYAYFNFLDVVNGRYRNYVARSTDGGTTWESEVEVPTTSSGGPDKNYMAIDVNAGSSYEDYIYVVWTDFPGSNPIRFSRSTNGGQSFSGNLNISGGTTIVQGAVPAVAPNGDVYAVWGIGNPAATGIGFNRSTDGGSSFVHSTPPTITSVTQIGTYSNSRYRLKITQQYPDGIRVNSFPSVAVDRSGGSDNGSIYVVWADQRSSSPGSGTPDILLIKSTNAGSNWSSPVRVNDVTTGDQWFPWVDVGPDGVVNVVFYDSRNDQDNLLTECYVARSTDGGQTFTNYQVSDEQFTPVAIPGYASGYMGDYIGIASAQGKCYPFWMDNRNDGIYQVYTAAVSVQVEVAVDQRRELNQQLTWTQVGRWEEGPNFALYTVPIEPFNFTVGSREVLQGYQQLVTNPSEKYRVWERNQVAQLDTVQNHRGFTVRQDEANITSRFHTTDGTIIIKTDLIDAPGTTGGNIQFHDPWYIDFQDGTYGNNWRNRGMVEPRQFHSRNVGSTGWQPDFTIIYPEGPYEYNGVFLNQDYNIPGNPYYSAGAPVQEVNGITWNFLNWTGDPNYVAYQDANAPQTGVVFKLSGAMATATYKAHLASSVAAPSGTNSQRKVGVTTYLHFAPSARLLYESGGDCWMSDVAIGEDTWSPEYRITDGTGLSGTPSVSSWNRLGEPGYSELYTMYRKQNGGNYDIYFRGENHDHSWESPVLLNTNRPVSVSKEPHPVVARANGDMLAFWEGNDTLMVAYGWADSWQWLGVAGWEETGETELNFRNPSLSTGHGTEDPGFLYQTFDNGNDVHFWSWDGVVFVNIGRLPASLSPVSYSAQVTGELTTGAQEEQKVHVAWEAWGGEVPPPPSTNRGNDWGMSGSGDIRRVIYQGFTGILDDEPQWTAADEFVNSNGHFYRPTITHLASGTLLMAWDDGSSTYQAMRGPEDEKWSVFEAYNELVRPNYIAGETDLGPLTETRFVGSSSTGPLYSLYFGNTVTDAPQTMLEQYSRRIEAAAVPPIRRGRLNHSGSIGSDREEGQTGEATVQEQARGLFGVQLSQVGIRRSDGSVERIPFVAVHDAAPGLNDDNAWDKMGTVPFTLPANADSIIISGRGEAKDLPRILGEGINSLGLAFDLVDAQSGEVLKQLGNERLFRRDSTEGFLIRSRVDGFREREVIIRPRVLGIAGGRRDIAYTVVHVHSLATESEESLPLAKVPGEGENLSHLPAVFALHQNYPNPFNPTTDIRFDLPEAGYVSLVVYDVLGRKIAELAAGPYGAGYHTATWNASDQASGVYFARFTATSAESKPIYTKVNKLVLMK